MEGHQVEIEIRLKMEVGLFSFIELCYSSNNKL